MANRENKSDDVATVNVCKEILWQWIASGLLSERLPEVVALRDVPQPEKYHREGDVYAHTLLSVDAVTDEADVRVFWATLLHDIGKSVTTCNLGGRIHSFGHAEVGGEMAREVMARLGLDDLADDVSWLVRHHGFHFSWNVSPGMRLSAKQQRFTRHPLFSFLIEVCIADARGSLGGEGKMKNVTIIQQASRNHR